MADTPKVLLVVAHPVIASGIETLLRLEGEYDLRRAPSVAEAIKSREWGPDVALVDGTLLSGYADVALGAPAYVLSGNERDGRSLARKLDDGRGWLRKDATGPELARAIEALMRPKGQTDGGIGPMGTIGIVVASLIALGLVAYLIWLAIY